MKISPLPFQIPLIYTTQAANIFLKTIYQFPEPVHIENIHTRENGQLLLSTFANGTLFTIDPTAPNASATPIITLSHEPGYALTGIASLGNNQYAISGGIHSPTAFSFQNNTMNIHVISLPAAAANDAQPSTGALLATIPIANPHPHPQLLNGMAALPASPWIVLSAESLCGCIYRIDTRTHDHDILLSSAEFASMDPAMPVGINGLQIRGKWLYFTNSGRGIFGRVEINGRGERVGDVEVVARLRDMVGAGVGVGGEEFYDDFTLDGRGNAYVALHPHSVVRIAPDGGQMVVVGGGNSTFLLEPTALSTSRDGKSVYLVTGGAKMGSKGGQVIQILI